MKKILLLLLCAAMVLSIFSGCAAEDKPYEPTGDALAPEDADVNATIPDEEEEPQEFSLAYYTNRSMNPTIATDFTNRMLFSLIYQGLFFVDSNNQPVPILCKNYKFSTDSRTFTFFLRDDATFSDGTPVTVEDALATYTPLQGASSGFAPHPCLPCAKGGAPQGRRDCLQHRLYEHRWLLCH